MKRTHLAAYAALTVLTACTPQTEIPTTTTTITASPTEEANILNSNGDPTNDAQAGDWQTITEAKLGQAVNLGEGLGIILVSHPTVFQPGKDLQTADKNVEYVVLEITETNNGDVKMPEDWQIIATSGGMEAPQVNDPDQGIGAPNDYLAPGESITYKLGFSRTKGEPFEVKAYAPFGYDYAIFKD